jgi:hypothetical protein
MGLTKRVCGSICISTIYNALTGASYQEVEQIKGTLDLSGFHYSGSGFYFLGDNVQIDNNYILDAGLED